MASPAPTRISQIIDAINAAVALGLPGHQILFNPDDLTENPAGIVKAAWGLTIEDAENTERCFEGSAYYYRRNFTVIITRSAAALYSDPATRDRAQKDILEDLNLVLQEIKGTRTLQAGTKQVAFDFKFVKDSGPRPVRLHDVDHLFVELTISAEYRET